MVTQKTGRMPYIDALRAFGASLVFVGHFISSYLPYYEILWEEGHIMLGISGKFVVSLFCVLLGFFAAGKRMEPKDVPSYIVRRYLQFAIPLLLISSLTALEMYVRGLYGLGELAVSVLEESLLFQNRGLCFSAWCIRDFFIGSVIIAVLRSRTNSLPAVLAAIAICLLSKEVWVANCLWGYVAWWVHQKINREPWLALKKKVLCPPVKLLLVLFVFFLIRRPLGYVTHMLDGIASMIIVLLFLNSSLLQRLFSGKLFSDLGGVSFEIYLLHSLVYPYPRKLVVWLVGSAVSEEVLFLISLAVAGVVLWFCAKGLHWLLRTPLFRLPYKLFDSPFVKV